MKKFLQTLFLISFLAVLVVPTVTLAVENCINQACNGPVGTVPCMCGANTQIPDGSYYCWGAASRSFGTQSACQSAMSGGTTSGGGSITSLPQLINLIDEIYGYIFAGLMSLAGIFILVSGYFFITAGGATEKITDARRMLVSALVGVAVAVGTQGLIAIVRNLVG